MLFYYLINNTPNPTGMKSCPGVCVAQRISSFCEALLDVNGLCKSEQTCCVAASLFNTVNSPPKEFILQKKPGKDKNDTTVSLNFTYLTIKCSNQLIYL